MAFGNGFASLLGGFVDGAETRARWDDRLDAKKRQRVLDGYEAQRQERLGELHGWDRETHGTNMEKHRVYMDVEGDADRLRELAWEDDQRLRQIREQAAAAAEAGLIPTAPTARGLPAPGPVEGAAGTVAAPAPGQPAPSLPMNRGTGRPLGPYSPPPRPTVAPTPSLPMDTALGPLGPYSPPPRGLPARPAPGEGGAHIPFGQRDYPFSPSYSDPGSMRTLGTPGEGRMFPGERPSEQALLARAAERAGPAPAPVDARDIALEARVARAERGVPPAPPAGDPARDPFIIDRDHEWGNAGADVREVGQRIGRGLTRVGDAVANTGLRAARQWTEPVNGISRWLTGENAVNVPDALDRTSQSKPRKEPEKPDGTPMTEGQRQAATATTRILEDALTKSPGMAEAAAAVTRGLKPSDRLTPAQRATGAQTWMQSYRENGAPLEIKELMRQGKFDQAEALRTFIDTATAQEGMEAWAEAVFAAQQGDTEAAVSGIIRAYNSNGYFNDGYQIDPERTELIRADDGEVMGIRMAVVDQQTGEVTMHEDTVPDLIEKGAWLVSPANAAQTFLERQAAARAAMLEMDAERRELEGKIVQIDARAVNDLADKIVEDSKVPDPQNPLADPRPTISREEAQRQAEAIIYRMQTQQLEGEPGADAGDVPVARRQ